MPVAPCDYDHGGDDNTTPTSQAPSGAHEGEAGAYPGLPAT